MGNRAGVTTQRKTLTNSMIELGEEGLETYGDINISWTREEMSAGT